MSKRTFLAFSILALALACWPLPAGSAASSRVLMDSHKSAIDISLSYDGDRIVFFGLNPDPGSQLIVKLVSKERDEVRLSVKDRFGPLWMARRQYRVTGAPVMYKVISTAPLDKIIGPKLAGKLGLGYQALKSEFKLEPLRGKPVPGEGDKVLRALLALKEAQGLYHVFSEPGRLHLIERRLYRHHFHFPPTAGEGAYLVETYAVRKGQVVGYGRHEVQIRKVGLQAWLTDAAQRQPLWYGLGAVLVAALAGLGVGFVFKRGGHH